MVGTQPTGLCFIVFLPQDINWVASYLAPSRALLHPTPFFSSEVACSHSDGARFDGGRGVYTNSLPFSSCPISPPLANSSSRISRAFDGLSGGVYLRPVITLPLCRPWSGGVRTSPSGAVIPIGASLFEVRLSLGQHAFPDLIGHPMSAGPLLGETYAAGRPASRVPLGWFCAHSSVPSRRGPQR